MADYFKVATEITRQYSGDLMAGLEQHVLNAEQNAENSRRLADKERCGADRLPDGVMDDVMAIPCNGSVYAICQNCGYLCLYCSEQPCGEEATEFKHVITWRRW